MANPNEPNPDWRQGYGFQFWMARHGYRGDGAYGQFCVILPEHDTVIATTADTADMQGVLDALWTHLLPAIGGAAGEPDPADDAARRATGHGDPAGGRGEPRAGRGRRLGRTPVRRDRSTASKDSAPSTR